MIKRFDITQNAWLIGYWISNTTFKIVRLEKL